MEPTKLLPAEQQPAVVYRFRKNAFEDVRAVLNEYNGQQLVDIRVWIELDGVWKPTRKGISVGVDLLPELAQAVSSLEKATA